METRELYLDKAEDRMPAVRTGHIVPITRARQVAQDLAQIVRECKLSLRIGQTEYVRYEGWQIMCALLNVGLPTIVEVERIQLEGDAYAYRAVAEFELMGRVYRAESRCDSTERNWQGKPEYAVMAMAQTRASGRVMRMCLGWIMPLAGYSGTPAEEAIDADVAIPTNPTPSQPVSRPARNRRSETAQAQATEPAPEPAPQGNGIAHLRAALLAKWAQLHPIPDDLDGDARQQAEQERNRGLGRFIRQHYPQSQQLRDLTAEQLQHLLQLLEQDVFAP